MKKKERRRKMKMLELVMHLRKLQRPVWFLPKLLLPKYFL